MSGKPELTPPATPRPFSPDPRASRLKVMSLIAFLVLAIIAVGVVVVLPDRLAQQQSHGSAAALSASTLAIEQSVAEVKSHQQQVEAKKEAGKLLVEVLKHQARLEMEGIEIWGSQVLATSYPDAMAKLSEADAYFNAKRFDLSANTYRETIGMLEQLASSRPERIERALQTGMDALEQLDSKTAMQQFEITLSMDPENKTAKRGLQRALNLPRVMGLVKEAKLAEDNGELERARDIYQEASVLDEDDRTAQESLERVTELILTREYQRLVAKALSALQQENYPMAHQALDGVRRLKPDTAEVQDIDRRLQTSKRVAELARLHNQARNYEQREQWQQAVQAYAKALAIDAHASFALNGKLRSEKFSALNEEIDGFLENPEVLQASKSLAKAREFHRSLIVISDVNPKLHAKHLKLGQLIDAYSRLVPLVLQSDDMTDVMIYRVGRYGQFREQRLKLRPGRYTALGTRSGYRDVRIEFNVPVSGMETTLIIYCKETI